MKKMLLSLLLCLSLLMAGCGDIDNTQSYNYDVDSNITTNTITDAGLEVHFIDVGQADCALIICEGETMLIDGGNVADSSLVVAYLTKMEVEYLNVVVGTHAHEDHIGGLAGALSQFSAGVVYSPVDEYSSTAFSNFKKYTEEQGLELVKPVVGETWQIGSAIVTVLGPVEDYSDANNTSIVLKLEYGETSFLFTGDAELESEQDMLDLGLDLEATVLKVGHHGSYTSTSYAFLRAVNPEYAVIQCGLDNDYGHPHDEVMSRLSDADVTVYRNDLQGTIICYSDGENLEFVTDKNTDIETNPEVTTAETGVYIGNINSLIFHDLNCTSLPAEQNQVYFESRAEAINAGYTACGRCNP